jgi:hypothetical protein
MARKPKYLWWKVKVSTQSQFSSSSESQLKVAVSEMWLMKSRRSVFYNNITTNNRRLKTETEKKANPNTENHDSKNY